MKKTTAMTRAVSLGLSFSLFAGLLGACGKGDGEPAGSSADPAASKEPVEITFYRPNTGTTVEQFNQIMGDAIKAKFPNVIPKFIPYADGSHMEDVLASGQDLDILILSIGFVPSYPNYNIQYDMTEMIKKYKYDLNRLEPTTTNFIQEFGNGQIYALPIFTTAAVLMYNKDLFDKFGVPYPRDGMTWDDTYELAKKMTRTDGGTQYYGFGTSVGHMLRVNQLSVPFVDPKTNQPMLASENYRKLVENFARFYNMPNAQFDSNMMKKQADMFVKDRNLAMYAYFNSTMVGAPDDMNVDAVPLPSFKEAPGIGSQMYPTFAGITGTSKHKDLAFQIIAYMTSDEFQTKFAKDGTGLPVVKKPEIISVFSENVPHLKGKNIQAFYPDKPAAIAPKTEYDSIAEKYSNTAFNQVATGQKDVVTALREANEQAAKDIQAELGK